MVPLDHCIARKWPSTNRTTCTNACLSSQGGATSPSPLDERSVHRPRRSTSSSILSVPRGECPRDDQPGGLSGGLSPETCLFSEVRENTGEVAFLEFFFPRNSRPFLGARRCEDHTDETKPIWLLECLNARGTVFDQQLGLQNAQHHFAGGGAKWPSMLLPVPCACESRRG